MDLSHHRTGDVLEIGAFESLRTDDLAGFERYLSLLATYYNDLSCVRSSQEKRVHAVDTDLRRSRTARSSTLPRSSNEAPLFALSLLRLLSQNRIAEFHTLLETLGENKADVLESGEVSWVLQVRFHGGLSLVGCRRGLSLRASPTDPYEDAHSSNGP